MTDELEPRASGEYSNELIVHGLEVYDAHKALLLRNITQSGYTLGNVPVAATVPVSRESDLQAVAQDADFPPQVRTAALRELLSIRGLNGNAQPTRA